MKILAIFLILFGIIILIFPEIIAYLIGGFILFLGINILLLSRKFDTTKSGKESYVKFGNYKIYR